MGMMSTGTSASFVADAFTVVPKAQPYSHVTKTNSHNYNLHLSKTTRSRSSSVVAGAKYSTLSSMLSTHEDDNGEDVKSMKLATLASRRAVASMLLSNVVYASVIFLLPVYQMQVQSNHPRPHPYVHEQQQQILKRES